MHVKVLHVWESSFEHVEQSGTSLKALTGTCVKFSVGLK